MRGKVMLRKKEIYDKIVHILSVFKNEIEAKASANLLDDNVLSENLIKDLLNECMGWNLVNLNSEQSNFPGIDLGDQERRIAVQITSTKTSKKIEDSLKTIIRNKVDESYTEIYFFILGKKQTSYSVKFDQYATLDCSVENIWDIDTLLNMCSSFDAAKSKRILDILEREFVTLEINELPAIPIEMRQAALELKVAFDQIFHWTQIMMDKEVIVDMDSIDTKILEEKVSSLMDYMDDVTYLTLKKILEHTQELKQYLKRSSTWSYRVYNYCWVIQDYIKVKKNIELLCNWLSSGKTGLDKELILIVDGENLEQRLVDQNIKLKYIHNQFSIENLKKALESVLYRKCSTAQFWASNEYIAGNQEYIDRIQSEGTVIKNYDSRDAFFANISAILEDSKELSIISTDINLFTSISDTNSYIYTASINKDIPSNVIPQVYSFSSIENYLNACFVYKEGRSYSIRTMSEEDFCDMIANGNDRYEHQIRVDWSGSVYLSQVTGLTNIEGVKFRWESFNAGNGYAGPLSASDDAYMHKLFLALKKNWEEGARGYIDDFLV